VAEPDDDVFAQLFSGFDDDVRAPADRSLWTGAGYAPLSRAFLDDRRSGLDRFQLAPEEAFPIDLPADYSSLRFYVPVSLRKAQALWPMAGSLARNIRLSVQALSGESDEAKYQAARALLPGQAIRLEQDDRDPREVALFRLLRYQVTEDNIVDASHSISMEELLRDVFEMRSGSGNWRALVDLLTPGRQIYREDFRGRQVAYDRGVRLRDNVIMPLFQIEAIVIREVLLLEVGGTLFEVGGEAVMQFLGFLARTSRGAAVIETLARGARAILLAAQLRLGAVVKDAVPLLVEITRLLMVLLLTILHLLMLAAQLIQASADAMPAVVKLVEAAFEVFVGLVDATVEAVAAESQFAAAGFMAFVGMPETDDPAERQFLDFLAANWSRP